MLVAIDVPDDDSQRGIRRMIDAEAVIESKQMGDGEVVISANAAGLTMLATHLLTLAHGGMCVGADMINDEFNELSGGAARFRFVTIP